MLPRRALRFSGSRTLAQLPNQLPNSNLPSLDFSPEVQEEQTTGAKSSKDSLSSVEIRRRRLGRISLAVLALGFGINMVYMGREWDESELKAKKLTLENAPATRFGRTKERFIDIFDYFNKPAWPELLPPPPPPPHQKPYTLLISIDDLLVTSTWDRQHGWRTAKRPGVDYFLAYISQFYEVVVFTSQNFYTAAPILDKLDRYNFYISHRLYREATRSINGKIVKDLSYLNRPLNTVISLDTNPEHVSTHPENAIDVRPILSAYQGKDIPLEYAKKEAEAKALHIEKWTKERPQGIAGSNFSSMLGLSQSTPRRQIPLTYLEQKRLEAQQQYQEEQKYIQQNKDYLEGLLKKEQEMMASEIPGTLWEAIGQLSGDPNAKKKPTDPTQAGKEVSGQSGGCGIDFVSLIY
ncbi:Mitochondrial import inner membrane translocase subunit TIM50 [Mycena venus]|uniref:Mitochondrial import inner membrane translocase subunit TIM50 n=1 Tax=Mycena venus TaxID=2733690 RepID=A0A8H6YBM0_9AGAR|nr:Mitochondrial import inner membrane translocase subunit TIM50 [Mycena venus]